MPPIQQINVSLSNKVSWDTPTPTIPLNVEEEKEKKKPEWIINCTFSDIFHLDSYRLVKVEQNENKIVFRMDPLLVNDEDFISNDGISSKTTISNYTSKSKLTTIITSPTMSAITIINTKKTSLLSKNNNTKNNCNNDEDTDNKSINANSNNKNNNNKGYLKNKKKNNEIIKNRPRSFDEPTEDKIKDLISLDPYSKLFIPPPKPSKCSKVINNINKLASGITINNVQQHQPDTSNLIDSATPSLTSSSPSSSLDTLHNHNDNSNNNNSNFNINMSKINFNFPLSQLPVHMNTMKNNHDDDKNNNNNNDNTILKKDFSFTFNYQYIPSNTTSVNLSDNNDKDNNDDENIDNKNNGDENKIESTKHDGKIKLNPAALTFIPITHQKKDEDKNENENEGISRDPTEASFIQKSYHHQNEIMNETEYNNENDTTTTTATVLDSTVPSFTMPIKTEEYQTEYNEHYCASLPLSVPNSPTFISTAVNPIKISPVSSIFTTASHSKTTTIKPSLDINSPSFISQISIKDPSKTTALNVHSAPFDPQTSSSSSSSSSLKPSFNVHLPSFIPQHSKSTSKTSLNVHSPTFDPRLNSTLSSSALLASPYYPDS